MGPRSRSRATQTEPRRAARQPDWEQLAAEDRAALDRAGHATMALVPVSSRVREQAIAAPDEDARKALDRASRLPDLWAAVRRDIVAPLAERRNARLAADAL